MTIERSSQLKVDTRTINFMGKISEEDEKFCKVYFFGKKKNKYIQNHKTKKKMMFDKPFDVRDLYNF